MRSQHVVCISIVENGCIAVSYGTFCVTPLYRTINVVAINVVERGLRERDMMAVARDAAEPQDADSRSNRRTSAPQPQAQGLGILTTSRLFEQQHHRQPPPYCTRLYSHDSPVTTLEHRHRSTHHEPTSLHSGRSGRVKLPLGAPTTLESLQASRYSRGLDLST